MAVFAPNDKRRVRTKVIVDPAAFRRSPVDLLMMNQTAPGGLADLRPLETGAIDKTGIDPSVISSKQWTKRKKSQVK